MASDGRDWRSDNVANLGEDATSIWNLHQRLLRLRKEVPALSIGSYRPRFVDEDLLVYFRELDDTTLLVALNLTSQAQSLSFEPAMEKCWCPPEPTVTERQWLTASRFAATRDSSLSSDVHSPHRLAVVTARDMSGTRTNKVNRTGV